MIKIAALIYFIAASFGQASSVPTSFDPNGAFPLPNSPRGSVAVIYSLPVGFFGSEFRKYLKNDITDCRAYLESLGVQFSKNGYAYFFKKQSMLILCTTRKNQDFMNALSEIQ